MDKIKKYQLDKILKDSSPQREDLIIAKFREFIRFDKKEETFYLFDNLFFHSGKLQYEKLSERLQNEIKDIMAECLVDKKFDFLDKFWIIAEMDFPSVESNLRHKLAIRGDAQSYDYIEKKELSFEEHYVTTAIRYKNYKLANYLIEDKKKYKGSENIFFVNAVQGNYLPLMESLYPLLNKKDPELKKDIFNFLDKISVQRKNETAEWLLKKNFDFSSLFEKNNNYSKLLNDMSKANLFKLYHQAEKKDLLGPYIHLHMQQHSPNEVVIEIFFQVCSSAEKVMKNLSRSPGYEKFFSMLGALVLKEKIESNCEEKNSFENKPTKGIKI